MGLKPSANQGKARLRGLYRIIYSKTIISVYTPLDAGISHDTETRTGINVSENCYKSAIPQTISPRLCKAKPACAGYTGLCIQRPSPSGERAGALMPETDAAAQERARIPGKGRPCRNDAELRHCAAFPGNVNDCRLMAGRYALRA